MNQKEYDLIADAIHRTHIVTSMEKNQIKRWAKYTTLRLLVTDLTATFAHVYPKTFDKDKFSDRCGL